MFKGGAPGCSVKRNMVISEISIYQAILAFPEWSRVPKMSSVPKNHKFSIFSLNFHQIPLDVYLGGTRDLSIADLDLANILAQASVLVVGILSPLYCGECNILHSAKCSTTLS